MNGFELCEKICSDNPGHIQGYDYTNPDQPPVVKGCPNATLLHVSKLFLLLQEHRYSTGWPHEGS
jgi:hypothetical protein